MFSKYFSKFLNYAVMIILLFAAAGSVINTAYSISISSSIIPIFIIIGVYFLCLILHKKHGYKIWEITNRSNVKAILYIVILALILRIIWVILIPTIPSSDFNLMFKCAGEAAQGNYNQFKGHSYFARFTHDTVTILYFSLFYHVADNPLFLIKFFNAVLQTMSVYLLYAVIKETIGEKSALEGALILSVFPPYIMYTSVTMSENIALPFYLLSICLFIKGSKDDKSVIYLVLCGLVLSIGNMFRMVGTVFLIAYIMYLLIYKGIRKCFKSSLKIVTSYALLFILVSQCLLTSGITETNLWNSKEPMITSILKGTNFENYGMWNKGDAKISSELNYDADKIKEVSKEIIVQRLKAPAYKVTYHYIRKLSMQWGQGDLDAYGWAAFKTDDTAITKFVKNIRSEINVIINLFYLTLLISIIQTLLKRGYKSCDEMNLFFILFGGFVIMYLLTEMQARYSLMAAWLLIIFAVRTKENKNAAIN